MRCPICNKKTTGKTGFCIQHKRGYNNIKPKIIITEGIIKKWLNSQ
jgi:hypothetical protein